MKKVMYVLIACILFSIRISSIYAEEISKWQTYKDEENGFELKHPPAMDDLMCGVGKYGSLYDENFGCKGPKNLKMLVYPSKNTKGEFEINVQSKFIRAKPDSILEEISKHIPQFGYSELSPISIDGNEGVRFIKVKRSSTREIWYILKNDLLLEIDFMYTGSPESLNKEVESYLKILKEIASTIRFLN